MIPVLHVLLVVVGLVIAIAVLPLLGAGPAVPDDFTYSVWTHADARWSEVWSVAKSSGRLVMLTHLPLNFVPYLVDSRVYLKTVQIGSMVATLLLFAYAFSRFTGERYHGIVAALLFAALLQNMWEHHIYAAYPFVFQLGGALLILALLSFKARLEGAPAARGVLAGVLFFLSLLTYEAFLAYVVLFVAIAWHARRSRGTKAVTRALVPVLAAAGVFAVAYAAWRVAFPSDYAGAQVELGRLDARAAVSVVVQFTRSALPGYVFSHFDNLHARFAESPAGYSRSIGALVAGVRIEGLVKALLVGLGIWLAQRIRPARATESPLLGRLSVAALLLVLPVLPVALTAKYQEWVASGAQAYVVTYFAYFGVIVAATAVTARLGTTGGEGSRSRGAAVATCVVVWAALSLVTDHGNRAMHRSQALNRERWELFNALVASPDFAAVPAGSCVLLDGLTTPLAFGTYKPFLWQVAAHEATGKEFAFTDERAAFARCADAGQRPAFLLRYRQEENVGNQLIALARVADANVTLLQADRMVVYWSGVSRRFALMLRIAGENRSVDATVNGLGRNGAAPSYLFPVATAPREPSPHRVEVNLPGMAVDAVSATSFVE